MGLFKKRVDALNRVLREQDREQLHGHFGAHANCPYCQRDLTVAPQEEYEEAEYDEAEYEEDDYEAENEFDNDYDEDYEYEDWDDIE